MSHGDSESLKTLAVKAEVKLPERFGDDYLTTEELQRFELFGRLKKPIPADKYPGSIVLRSFSRGEVVCRQGEPGFSAFYVPRLSDLATLTGARPDEPAGQPTDGSRRSILTAHLLAGTSTARKRGFFRRWFGPAA